MISKEQYKELCKNYFRDMYAAGWSGNNPGNVPGCEAICDTIRSNPSSDEAISYNNYVNFRNANQGKFGQQASTPVQEGVSANSVGDATVKPQPQYNAPVNVAQKVEHTPDAYTKKDGLHADERLEASQKHTVIMLLTDIAVSCRAIAKAMNATRDDESVNVYEASISNAVSAVKDVIDDVF